MVYLDHHAATPLCEAARVAMTRAEASAFANPSSAHAAGRAARALLEEARRSVAAAIGATAADIVFTSGGSEACNLGVRGLLERSAAHVVTSEIEHPAVASPLEWLEQNAGLALTRLAVPAGLAPSPGQLAEALRSETQLVALQWVNHETGTILPVAEYARVCRAAGVPLFVDATQAPGKLPIDVEALGADLIAFAAHKLGGPAGAGALWVRRGLEVESLLRGGAQERGRRAGSPAVASLVGFGAACAVLAQRLAEQPRIAQLQRGVEAALEDAGAILNGGSGRVATVVNASVPGWSGPELVAALDLEGVCAASGAACSSGLAQPSPVLRAMYPSEPWRAEAALRLSFGPETVETDIEFGVAALRRVLARGRAGAS